MFFSILIPVYNAEKYIDKCLNSIFIQNEKDFEIIMVDDGSTDNSLSVCKEWESRYPEKIKVIAKENSGSLETRRICLTNASGEFLYFIDADDFIIEKNALEIIRKNIEKTQCDLIIFNATVDGKNKTKLYQYPFKDESIYQNESLTTIYEVLLQGTQLNTLWNKVFSRNLVDWDADYSKCQNIIKGTDFYQILPVISNAKKIMYIDQVFYLYNVQSNGSISHRFKPLLYKTTCLQHQRLLVFAKSWSIRGKEKMLKQRFTSDVAQIILMMSYVEDISLKEKINFFKMIRQDEMYLKNHNSGNLKKIRKLAIKLLDLKAYHILLLYVKSVGVYKTLHEKYLNRLS